MIPPLVSVRVAEIRRLHPLPDVMTREAHRILIHDPPIRVLKNPDGKLVLVDGYRTLAAAVVLRRETIDAYVVEEGV